LNFVKTKKNNYSFRGRECYALNVRKQKRIKNQAFVIIVKKKKRAGLMAYYICQL
jgi:hypothetical protein